MILFFPHLCKLLDFRRGRLTNYFNYCGWVCYHFSDHDHYTYLVLIFLTCKMDPGGTLVAQLVNYQFSLSLSLSLFFFFFFKILFIHLTECMWESTRRLSSREREKQTPCQAGSPMWGLIWGPQDHDLSQRQMSNQPSHPGTACINSWFWLG